MFKSFDELSKSSRILKDIDNNDNKNISNIDIIDKGKYAFKRGFDPSNPETQAAFEIASTLGDLKNFAFYCSVVKRLSPSLAREVLSDTLNDVRLGAERGRPIRNPGALYNWKVRNLYG